MTIENIKTDDVIPYVNNPRENDDAVDKVAASIKEFGFKVPIVIDKENVVVAGHTRLKAAKKLGLETVPCIKADDLNEQQVKAFRLADNKVGEFAKWDDEKLLIELDSISDLCMYDFGFETLEPQESTTSTSNTKESDFDYQSQYGVIVMCKDEAEQESIYNKLVGEGYECRVVAV